MLSVTVYRNPEGIIQGLQFSGHADFREAGEDIVCAAASVLAENTVNSIERFTEDGFEYCALNEEEGFLSFRLKSVSADSRLLLDSLLLGLQGIEESYGDHIQIQYEEVP